MCEKETNCSSAEIHAGGLITVQLELHLWKDIRDPETHTDVKERSAQNINASKSFFECSNHSDNWQYDVGFILCFRVCHGFYEAFRLGYLPWPGDEKMQSFLVWVEIRVWLGLVKVWLKREGPHPGMTQACNISTLGIEEGWWLLFTAKLGDTSSASYIGEPL